MRRAPPPPPRQDFKGQLHNERFFQILVVIFGLVGFVAGYIRGEFQITFLFLATGGGISAVVCLPDWPWWNRHPLEWLPAEEEEEEQEAEKKKKKGKKDDAGGKKTAKKDDTATASSAAEAARDELARRARDEATASAAAAGS